MTHLLDSNAWICYMRSNNPVFMARMQNHGPHNLGLGSIVLGELYFGANHSGPKHLQANLVLIERIRRQFPSIAFDAAEALDYGDIRQTFSAAGMLIGPNDIMIAAMARANNLILVTHNSGEFSRVPGLQVEDGQIP